MGNVEAHLAADNARFLKHVKIGTLCTDNDSKLIHGTQSVFPDAQKSDCTVHVSSHRGQRRHFFCSQLTNDFYDLYPTLTN